MKAELKPRINLEERTKLETVIPIETPYVLFVDPSSACNFRCTFCPTGDRQLIRETGRWQGAMDFDLFRKIIDDLKEFESPIKVLRLYKDGEPLMNKRLPEMIRYAKESGRVDAVDTTTNGSLLTPERSLKLVDAGLDRINISVDGLSDSDFEIFTQTKTKFADLVANVRFFYENKKGCEVCVKMPGDLLSAEQKEFFFSTFGDICDRISLENIAPCWPEFGVEERMNIEITTGIYNNPISEVSVCPYIFYSFSINSDGSVSLCFLDWARKLPVGDVRKQSLREIWQSQELYDYRRSHLVGDRKKYEVCGSCGQLSHCLPDNIDVHAIVLLEKITAARTTPR